MASQIPPPHRGRPLTPPLPRSPPSASDLSEEAFSEADLPRGRSRSRSRTPTRARRSLAASVDAEGFIRKPNNGHGKGRGHYGTFSTAGDGNSVSATASTSFASPSTRRGRPRYSASPSIASSFPTSRMNRRTTSYSNLNASDGASNNPVPPERDYLANWETLADLVVPPSPADVGSSRPRLRMRSPWGRDRIPFDNTSTPTRQRLSTQVEGQVSPAVMLLQSQQSHPQDIPGHHQPESEASFSEVLSTSPGNVGEPIASFGSVAQTMDSSFSAGTAIPPPPHFTPASNGTPLVSSTPMPATAPQKKPDPPARFKLPPYTLSILKCSLAYLIASLFTFVPRLSALLSHETETDVHGRVHAVPAYSSHMVATIVVYFNPAKSKGNMILSTRYCVILALFSTAVSFISFGIIAVFDSYSPSNGSQWDWISEMGDWVVCVACIGGGMATLAWLKLWVGDPAFNTGCSMAAVTLFTVIVKEGGWIKLKEVLFIVFIGVLITNIVCFTIFPVSGTSKLQESMSKSLNSFSTLLDLLGSTFLLETTVVKENRMSLADAVKSHGAAFKALKGSLAEAKHERLVDPRMRGAKLELYEAALGSMARLAQHLAAMRSSTRVQEALLRAARQGRISLDVDVDSAIEKRHFAESVVEELNELPAVTVEDEEDVERSVALFLQLQRLTGDDLDTLVATCDDALDGIEDVLTSDQAKVPAGVDLVATHAAVSATVQNFSRSSSRAIKRVYAGPRRRKGIYASGSSHGSASGSSSDSEDLDDEGPNEVVFLVYFFLFTLEEFARELLFLLDTITTAPKLSAWDQMRAILAPWTHRRKNFLYKQLQQLVPIDPSKLQPPMFPRTQRDERGTLLTPTPQGLSRIGKIYHWVWELGARLSEPDMRYALKTGLAGAILAAPSVLESTRQIFLEYRGEWALIAFFATMSPTLGQTNFLSFFRIVGTLLGGTVAVVACMLFPENAVVLPIFGFLFSMPCFYIITQMPDYAQAGRFILLTYNLTCLYAYNLRDSDKDLAPVTIAIRRCTSVAAGVVWAGFVSRYWWPYTARRELRMGLGDFCLDLSYLYSKLVTTYTRGVEELAPQHAEGTASPSEDTPLLPPSLSPTARHHLVPGVRQFMAMELHLQGQLATLRGLLAHSKNEPRLKGPFPFAFYNEVLLSCERMLDRLHSMRCVTTRHEWDQSIRQAFVLPVNQHQREMAGNVILYFYTLSAGFRLRIPMPPYLPPAEAARERLVDAIRDLDVVKRRSVRGGGRHLLFFAYALAMQEVIAELDYLGGLLQDAFGVISQSTARDFEDLFIGGAEYTDGEVGSSTFDTSYM